MAGVLLLPGFGGKVTLTLEVEDALASPVESDVIDCSPVAMLSFKVKSQTLGGAFSVQPKQSFDGVNWNDLGSPIIATGVFTKYDLTAGPFGLLRFDATFDDSDSAPSPTSSNPSPTWDGPFTSEIVIEVIGWEAQIKQ